MRSILDQVIIAAASLLVPSIAFAYLDPGTGSMILQGLIAGVAIAWFTIKTYWYKITGFFGGEKPEDILEEDEADVKEQN